MRPQSLQSSTEILKSIRRHQKCLRYSLTKQGSQALAKDYLNENYSHRNMKWFRLEGTLKIILFKPPLPQIGIPFTRPG